MNVELDDEAGVLIITKIPRRWGLDKFAKYIEAYDPEKPMIGVVEEKKIEVPSQDCEVRLDFRFRDKVYDYISCDQDGKITISDEFAEAINAKIMPKKTTLDAFDDWKIQAPKVKTVICKECGAMLNDFAVQFHTKEKCEKHKQNIKKWEGFLAGTCDIYGKPIMSKVDYHKEYENDLKLDKIKEWLNQHLLKDMDAQGFVNLVAAILK